MLGVHTPMPGRRPQSSSLGCSLRSSPVQGRPLYVPKGGPSLLTHPGTADTHSLFSKSAYFLCLWLKTMREEQASAFLKIKR